MSDRSYYENDVTGSVKGWDDIMISQDLDLFDDIESDWIDDRSEPEIKFKPEVEQLHGKELRPLRELKWLHDLPADPKETNLTIQDAYLSSINYINHDNTESNWIALDAPLCVPESNLDLLNPGYFCPGSGVEITHTKNLMIKKLKSAREKGELETEVENPEIASWTFF